MFPFSNFLLLIYHHLTFLLFVFSSPSSLIKKEKEKSRMVLAKSSLPHACVFVQIRSHDKPDPFNKVMQSPESRNFSHPDY
jgi:hypothetical protein